MADKKKTKSPNPVVFVEINPRKMEEILALLEEISVANVMKNPPKLTAPREMDHLNFLAERSAMVTKNLLKTLEVLVSDQMQRQRVKNEE